MKKSWNKPELTVLVRTRPEEAILGLCKNDYETGGTQNANSQCQYSGGFPCGAVCQGTPDS